MYVPRILREAIYLITIGKVHLNHTRVTVRIVEEVTFDATIEWVIECSLVGISNHGLHFATIFSHYRDLTITQNAVYVVYIVELFTCIKNVKEGILEEEGEWVLTRSNAKVVRIDNHISILFTTSQFVRHDTSTLYCIVEGWYSLVISHLHIKESRLQILFAKFHIELYLL